MTLALDDHEVRPGWWADCRGARPAGTGAAGGGRVDRGGRHRCVLAHVAARPDDVPGLHAAVLVRRRGADETGEDDDVVLVVARLLVELAAARDEAQGRPADVAVDLAGR